jgi:hypothetical protein
LAKNQQNFQNAIICIIEKQRALICKFENHNNANNILTEWKNDSNGSGLRQPRRFEQRSILSNNSERYFTVQSSISLVPGEFNTKFLNTWPLFVPYLAITSPLLGYYFFLTCLLLVPYLAITYSLLVYY